MSAEGDPVSIHAIVLAAGQSKRMGRPKQLLEYRGTTIVAHIVGTLLDASVTTVTVVTRSVLLPQLNLPDDPRVRVAVNDVDDSEMIDSVRVGLVRSSDIGAPQPNGIMIVPGDMPRIAPETFRKCIDIFQHDPTRLVVATFDRRRGHPLILPASLRPEIAGLEGGLNVLLETHQDAVVCLATDDPGVVENINTPEDYAKLLAGDGR